MYGNSGDQDQLLAVMGVPPEMRDALKDAATVDIWPEHDVAVNVFAAMATQWRSGMGGATGLDYAALPAGLDLSDVPKWDRADVFACVRVMESAALAVMAELRKG